MSVPDDGRLHKAINVNNKMHIIEEMVLFSEPQPVQHMELNSEKVAIQDYKTGLLISRAFQVGSNNEFTKCRHWQLRDPTSHGESQSPIGGAQDHFDNYRKLPVGRPENSKWPIMHPGGYSR